MTREPAWPLHPAPRGSESLRRYVERLARTYGVTFGHFCFTALGIAHRDYQARLFTSPTDEVLQRLSVGLGMPMDELRSFPDRQRRHVEEAHAELEAWIATPEGRLKFEQMFKRNVSRLGTPYWNTVTIFNESIVKWARDNLGQGDLVHARGTLRETSYEKDGETRYGVTLAADQFDRLVAKERA